MRTHGHVLLAGLLLLLGGCRAAPPVAPQVDPAQAAQLHRDVAELAAPAMAGRGLGAPGIERARDWIAARFATLGLAPAFTDGMVHRVPATSPDGSPLAVENVGAMLPGRGALAHEAVVISAHYDHLGVVNGQVHPGADDNASGVAAMLHAVQRLQASRPFMDATPRRTVLLVAFSGEEAGLIGSRGLAGDLAALRLPVTDLTAVVNLDMVGRLGEQRLTVLGVETSGRWPALLRGVAGEAGMRVRLREAAPPRSDQQPFAAQGVPAVLVHTGLHADYHRPTDTPAKIDAAGAVRVADFIARLVEHLANVPAPGAGL